MDIDLFHQRIEVGALKFSPHLLPLTYCPHTAVPRSIEPEDISWVTILGSYTHNIMVLPRAPRDSTIKSP